VLSADDSVTDRFSTLASRAVRQVGRVLPRWRGRLVVKVPASERGVERVTGADPDEYQGVAAVTTTADGSADPSSPTHVVVNPEVFGRLTPDGAQIVMSHETTHVATAASSSPAPTWLVEGFADYVALAGSDLPVSASAGQILDQVRSSGPPSRLPGARAFDPSRTAVGASYEAAWLACRMIADRYDERTLVEFYEAVDNGASVETGFRRVLDTDRGAFTSAWRGYLRRLA